MVYAMRITKKRGDKKSPLFFAKNLRVKLFYIIFDIQLNTKDMLTEKQKQLVRISNLSKEIFNSLRALELVAVVNNQYHISQINKRIKGYETELKSIVAKLG
jgi:hypothetical protein